MSFLKEKARPLPIEAIRFDSIEVRPMTGTIGAEVSGVDLNDPSDRQIEEIRIAFAKYLVLVFRDQLALQPESHIAFARLFGDIQPIVHLDHIEGYPEIQAIHRDAQDRRRVTGELYHNDSTYMATPPIAIAMRAIVLPLAGGDTAFANLQLAYDMLSPKMREIVDGLHVVHSARRLFGAGVDQSQFYMKRMDPAEGDKEVTHPLVITHPVSKRRSIFINPAYSIRIDGMSQPESDVLLDFLYRHATFMPLTMRVRWTEGTVVLWDNWAAYHSAIGDYEGEQRTLHRVTVGGFRPAA